MNSISREKEIVKRRLERSSQEHIANIEKELQKASDGLKKGGKSLLIVVGCLFSAYVLFEWMTHGTNKPDNPKKSKKKGVDKKLEKVKGLFFGLTEDLLNNLMVTLLVVLREKLVAYIDQLNEPKEYADLPEPGAQGQD